MAHLLTPSNYFHRSKMFNAYINALDPIVLFFSPFSFVSFQYIELILIFHMWLLQNWHDLEFYKLLIPYYWSETHFFLQGNIIPHCATHWRQLFIAKDRQPVPLRSCVVALCLALLVCDKPSYFIVSVKNRI